MPSPQNKPPDHGFDALLEAARNGDKEAQGRLLETCRRPLLYFARRRLSRDVQAKGGASDVVQDAFVNALREIDAFQGCTPDQLMNWLRTIMRRSLSNFERQFSSGKRQVAAGTPRGGKLKPDEVADAGPSPSEVVMRRERTDAFEQALARLPEPLREVVRFRHAGKLSFEEIGRRMGRSGAAARHLWLRAVAELGRGLAPSADSPK